MKISSGTTLRLGAFAAAMPLATASCGVVLGLSDFTDQEGETTASTGGSGADGSGATSSTTAQGGTASGGAGGGQSCETGAKDCDGNQPRECVGGTWMNAAPCDSDVDYRCEAGECLSAPSCATLLDPNCGTTPGVNCCTSTVVEGDTFNRNFKPANQVSNFPATVSSFRLDVFEVTVARFRAFVQSGSGVQANPPAAGAGAHPKIADSGWQSAFDAQLLADTAALETGLVDCESRPGSTWVDATMVALQEKPMNCLTWFEALAFCIWDGGRLPTAAEYNLAWVGDGTEQRIYPWGNGIDATRASYCPNAGVMQCLFSEGIILDVGSKPAGAGRWGQLDLIGSMREYGLDYFQPIPVPCDDCAQLDNSRTGTRAAMGWSWSDTQQMIDTFGLSANLSTRTPAGGFRCARDL